ncbi:MAG: type III-B CRISPR module RAMP protein Cmr4 [Candidatus Spyradenecus sp.]
MHKRTLTLFTRTPLHIGCGTSVGAVDQPILRERATGLPLIPGSALKGVLADLFLENNKRTEEGKRLLGEDDDKADAKRGSLLVGEARLVAFPIRSAKKGFAWITSPLLLQRLFPTESLGLPTVDDEAVCCDTTLCAPNNKAIFEEYVLGWTRNFPKDVMAKLQALAKNPLWSKTCATRLALVSDTLLTYFTQNACEIANHNRIDDETGTVADGALFSQENVPSEALFVATLQAQDEADLKTLCAKIGESGHLLQVGADASTGLGWCDITLQ